MNKTNFIECADNDLASALLALLDTVPAHQKLYPELYVDKIVELVNKKRSFNKCAQRYILL